MRLELDAIAQDRERLRERWSEQGYRGGGSISQALREGAARWPEVESIYYAQGRPRRATNRELYADGLELAAALHSLGLRAGDVVGVQLPSWIETAVLHQAILHVGAVALPIVASFGPAEVEFVLRQSRARALFAPGRWRGVDFPARASALRALPDLERIVVVGEEEPEGCLAWRALLARARPGFEPVASARDAVSLLLYTSGTTSAPKGVQHTHEALLWEWGRRTYASRGLHLASLPAGHYTGYGSLLRPSLLGAPMVFLDAWDAKLAAEVVERHRVRHGGGTPIFLFTLLEMAKVHGKDLSSLETFSMAGQGMTPAMIERADVRGFRGARVYGSTEHPTVTSFDPELPFEERAHTDGRVDAGNEVRIVDADGNDVAPGREGEVVSRGPEMFVGYLDPEL